MKNSEQNIRDIFGNKLSSFESDVAPNLWPGIEAALPKAVPVGTSAAKGVAKAFSAKIIGIAAAGIIAAGSVIYLMLTGGRESTVRAAEKAPQQIVQSPQQPNQPVNSSSGSTSFSQQSITGATESISNAVESQAIIQSADAPTEMPGTVISNQNDETTDRDETEQPETALNAPPADMIRGGSKLPTEALSFEATFTSKQVSEDDLKFFFFSQYPEEQAYQWMIDGQPAGSDISTSYTFADEGEHEVSLTVTNYKGESKTSHSTVEAYLAAELILPNIFTPSSDNKNNSFDPAAKSKNVTISSIRILDTNGKVIFETESAPAVWDGNDRFGNPAPPATYLAIVNATDHRGNLIQKQEFVTLRR